jgi:DnaJ-class molecular chaperone
MLNDPQVGDIIIVINIGRHAKFRVAQDDLLTAVQIDAVEAMLGVECNVNNIDGKVIKVKIPAGIQNGKLVRVAGKGMPNPEITGKRGDLLVQVGISIPNDLTEEEKKAIMNIRHRKSFNA